MEAVAIDRFGSRDTGGLLAFLDYCRSKALSDGLPRVASISLRVRDLDPLAVLQTIQEPREPHLYMERSPVSVSGAEAVVRLDVAPGEDRFEKAERFVAEWSERIIATGDLDGWFSGPLFFHAFSFSPANSPSATVFIPKWQICRTEVECIAVANARIDGETDLRLEAERILRAHRTFGSLSQETETAEPEGPRRIIGRHPEETERFVARVCGALESIRSKEVEKVVVSRWMDLRANAFLRPMELLRELREDFADCYSFSYSRGNGASWIGATPECLVKVSEDRFETEALAGSAPRGSGLSEDTKIGSELLASEKDLREHAVVVRFIRQTLERIGLEVSSGRHPHLMRLSNVQHLRTLLSGPREAGLGVLRIARALHPTPAVGGCPPDEALREIEGLEPFQRGLYTGFLGWEKPSGEGQSIVALRTGRIVGSSARLFAGAGIVAGSDPERELRETEIKLAAMIRVIEGRT